MAGWTNDHLEELIKSKQSNIPNDDPWFALMMETFLAFDEEQSVEAMRVALLNLAYRHSGFYDQTDGSVSIEGIEYSLKRILKLIGETIGHGSK